VTAYDKEDVDNHDCSKFDPQLKKSMMSFLLKTFYVYKEIAERHEHALILEDDVILSPNFSNTLEKYMRELPTDFDMLFLGNGWNLHIQPSELIPGKHMYPKGLYPTWWGGDGITRCTDSYIVSQKCAKSLCEYVKNLSYRINLSGDWWLNVAARDNKYIGYWAEPTIVTQGTQSGMFKSSH